MRIPPRVTMMGLPERYVAEISSNSEVACRIVFRHASTGEVVTEPVPLSLSLILSAEL
jgi:hypothetical protein